MKRRSCVRDEMRDPFAVLISNGGPLKRKKWGNIFFLKGGGKTWNLTNFFSFIQDPIFYISSYLERYFFFQHLGGLFDFLKSWGFEKLSGILDLKTNVIALENLVFNCVGLLFFLLMYLLQFLIFFLLLFLLFCCCFCCFCHFCRSHFGSCI